MPVLLPNTVLATSIKRGNRNLDRAFHSGLSDASIDLRTELRADSRLLHAATRRAPAQTGSSGAITAAKVIQLVLLILTAVLFGLHFVHLSADFPNHSPWMDWSKYTDEGWYGDAAIRQMQLGHWFVKGDFNPAVALPVWPALEYVLFRVTGVSLLAVRALTVSVFGGILVFAYLLLRRSSMLDRNEDLPRIWVAPSVSVALLAASPFCYAFTRLAILEPLLVVLTLAALWSASVADVRPVRSAVALGVLLPLMILTKTTAVFLLPSVAWMLWATCEYRLRPLLRVGVPSATIAAVLWSAYFFGLVRPRYLEDYRYLFSANAYTGMTRVNAWTVIQDTVRDGVWMGRFLYPVALLSVALAFVFFRRCFRNPLVPSLLLWAAGYAAFLAYHDNLQPRYYLVVAVPLTLLVPVIFEQIIRSFAAKARGLLLGLAAAVFATIFLTDAVETLHFVRTPEYTFTQAAHDLSRVVFADKQHNRLILSISGSDLSLMTGIASICDDFGTMALEDRAALYRPGWYATWNQVDDDKMDALSPLFHLERVASFTAFDDPERNLLILYRLDPPVAEQPQRKKRKPVPKRLQTRMGQQPSASQLEH